MRRYSVSDESLDNPDLAIVGMAVRLPGALDVRDYWRNTRAGVESIRRLTHDELIAAGEDPALLHDPNYVPVAATLDRLELFDAGFFGFSKREASVLDPQHRHFLEVCFEALEDAGVVPRSFAGAIGVFGGSGMNSYMPFNLFTNPELMRSMGLFLVRHTGNDKDFLTTRVSYCLNLKGPSVNVQTACSTSLVAIHLASQSLLAGECDVALAGGVTIELPHYRGYRFEEGEILSPDGHCRPFEARSKGTVFGSGAGVVVLKRLRDAVEAGDFIHAIVKGSAVNNDGDRKVGYLAPSVDGQADCVVEALQVAGLSARDISYVECHGTGTPVGDPIEVTALARAFARSTKEKGFCGIGSVKSNIGHLDTAAGVASFVKVVQMLEHEEIAPTLHFEKPNPEIEFSSTPFFVTGEARRWPRSEAPRRAGVSSLGVGGTNAHVIVEEAPRRNAPAARETPEIGLISARSPASLDALARGIARHCEAHPELALAELSSTLLHGRERFPFRRVLAARTLAEAATLLPKADGSRVFDVQAKQADAPIVFLFPGGGAQHANMAREVYANEPKFREAVDECLAILKRRESLDLAPLMFPPVGEEESASHELERPSLALPALLTIELAFARLLESFGIGAAAMLGHSLGEYAAAHLSGVVGLADVLGIVCCRGRLFERVQKGGMLSVPMSPAALEPYLTNGLALAAVNGPELCVVSGETTRLDELEQKLEGIDVQARRLHIDVPAHSPLLDPILPEFRAYLAGVKLGSATRPYVSNLTGSFITPEDISHEYFVRHLRSTVRFADGLAAVGARHPTAIYVEVGPGQTLSSLARLEPGRAAHGVVPLSPHVKDKTSDGLHFRTSIGRIIAHGGAANLDAVLGSSRCVVPLPTTPFEHERHWVEPGRGYFMARDASADSERETDVSRWFFTTTFREEPRAREDVLPGERWLVFAEGPLARSLLLEVSSRGASCVLVTPAERTEKLGPGHFGLKLSDPQGYEDLLQSLVAEGGIPKKILHALCLGPEMLEPDAAPNDSALDRAFFSLLHLAQVLGQEEISAGTRLLVGTSRACDVAGTTTLRPLHALAEGPVRVIPRELPLGARIFDILNVDDPEAAARALVDELLTPSDHALVAERGRTRYVASLERVAVDAGEPLVLPERPVVLFTGGLGGIARTLAAHFAATRNAKIALFSRSRLPEGEARRALRASLDEHDPRAEQLDSLIALEATGAEVVVESVDVSSPEDVRAAVERMRQRFGHVDVVVHAAGVLDDAPLALKDRESARSVLAPKVLGARNLADAFAGDAPALFLLLSSTSAALGPPGQCDYVAANAYVNALARRLRQSLQRSRVVGLGFGVWRDTGMAARAVGPFAPPLEGEATPHPLLEREQRRSDGSLEFQSLYDPAELWVLDEHRVRGASPVLPGTATLEIVRAAGARALAAEPGTALELRDVLFLSPLEVPDGQRRLVRVLVQPAEDEDGYEVTLASRGRDDRADVQHASGTFVAFRGPTPPDLPIEELETRSTLRVVRFEEGQQALPQDQYLAFGPRWRVIREMRFGVTDAFARLVVPERFAADMAVFGLHPGVLDMVSGFAFSLADPTGTGDRLRVPLSYQHVRIHAPLERELVSYVRLKQSSDDGLAVFDVWVANSSGRVLLEIQGYTTKSVAPASLVPAARAVKEPTLLERWAKLGITREEGAEVVERLLAKSPPAELYASPVSLFTLVEQLTPRREPAARSGAAATTASLVESRDAPRDDVERRLADMWCSLLGVERVGIRDNFFELGGHSLIAVRLFARIKKAYGIDLPLAVLFQAPTIEKCAEMLRRDLGIELSVDEKSRPTGSQPRQSLPERAFSHVVSIQDGNGSAPFFCVHGAGGNVLNFRALARHLGKEQPFFGLQARGVTGEAPLSSVEEMASVYVEEIRAVRPQGPYLLGGYSGGGVVAYEIAQRLRAEGAEVPLLVFLDTFHPSTTPRKVSFGEQMNRLLQEGPRYLARQGKGKLSRHLNELSTELKLLFYSSNDLPLPLELREHRLFTAFRDAASRYRPLPYDGHVLMFRARLIDGIYRHMGPTLGWRDIIPDLEIIEVPGGHDSLVLEPNVQVLTAHLTQAFARATSTKGAGSGA